MQIIDTRLSDRHNERNEVLMKRGGQGETEHSRKHCLHLMLRRGVSPVFRPGIFLPGSIFPEKHRKFRKNEESFYLSLEKTGRIGYNGRKKRIPPHAGKDASILKERNR